MGQELLVHRPGSWVQIGDDVPATVLAVQITESGVDYQVVWWDGRTRHVEWLASHEIRGGAVPQQTVGFIRA